MLLEKACIVIRPYFLPSWDELWALALILLAIFEKYVMDYKESNIYMLFKA